MNYSNDRSALSVSGANSDYYNQRSYNYTNNSYYLSDLSVSTLASSTGTVKPIKSTKNYLKELESKYNSDPDPRADLQLLSRHKNKNKDQHYIGSYRIEKELKDDDVPQIFRKMQPTNYCDSHNKQRNPIFQSSSSRNSNQMSQVPGSQYSPHKILNINSQNYINEREYPKRGFFQNMFSFNENIDNNNQIRITNYKQQKFQNIYDIEQSLIKMRDEMESNQKNINQQFDLTIQMKQQLGIAIDLVNRILRGQSTNILQQIIKSINRSRQDSIQQLYASEQQLMDNFYDQIEYLTSQKILQLKVNNLPTQEQIYEDQQQFYSVASQYIFNIKGYYPTKEQLDSLFNEINRLNVNGSEWIDFISRRI